MCFTNLCYIIEQKGKADMAKEFIIDFHKMDLSKGYIPKDYLASLGISKKARTDNITRKEKTNKRIAILFQIIKSLKKKKPMRANSIPPVTFQHKIQTIECNNKLY